MANFEVELIGTDELIENLKRIDANIRGDVALKAVNAGGIQIENKARINAPVRTGALRNSAKTISRNTADGAEAEIGFRGLAYARIQEFGGTTGNGGHIKGKHYLERAINETRFLVVDAMSDVVKAYLGS